MAVVVDTNALRYLIEIDAAHILEKMHGVVLCPRQVADQLRHENTPEKVRAFAESPPGWFVEVDSPDVLDATRAVGRGEAEAIRLAKDTKATLLTIDRRAGTAAEKEDVKVEKLFSTLHEAQERGLINAADAIRDLRDKTNLRGTPELFAQGIEEAERRQRQVSSEQIIREREEQNEARKEKLLVDGGIPVKPFKEGFKDYEVVSASDLGLSKESSGLARVEAAKQAGCNVFITNDPQVWQEALSAQRAGGQPLGVYIVEIDERHVNKLSELQKTPPEIVKEVEKAVEIARQLTFKHASSISIT